MALIFIVSAFFLCYHTYDKGAIMFENYGNYGFNPLFNNNNNNQPPTFNFTPMQPKANGNYFYVNGIEGAKSFFMSQPNTTVILFDSDSQDFFVKSTNAQGQAILRRFNYKECGVNETPKPQEQEFVSRKEFDALKAQINSLKPAQVQTHQINNNNNNVKGEIKQ